MSLSRIPYTADGSTQSFGVPFVFRDREDVFVYVDGTAATFTWQNDSQLTVTLPVVTNGAEVQVIRRTKSTALDVTFIDGSGLPAGDLNAAVMQLYYLLQESLDDLGAPVDASLSATQAAASAAAAVVSAAAAAVSAASLDLTTPGPIGGTTPSTGAFTTTTLTSVDIGSTIAITGVLDEDTLVSDSAVKLATQQSIKAYVDAASVVQMVNVLDGAVATGTTVMVDDDTIPQNTEGDQYMSLAVTPTNASNKLRIDVVMALIANSSTDSRIGAALFQDSTAGSLAAVFNYRNAATDNGTMIVFTHYMTAGTVSETTFKVRAGGIAAGTTTFNGNGAARKFGGVMASSITITEIKV